MFSAESLHGLLDASPSLDSLGVRRAFIMDLLEPALSPGYRAMRSRPRDTVSFGVAPMAVPCWPPTGLPGPGEVPPDASMAKYDLLDGLDVGRWIVRAQADAPTCVAQATTACIELALSRAAADVPRLSPRFVDDRLRALRPAPGTAACDEIPPGLRMAKLGEAARVLAWSGICREAEWDEGDPPDGTPISQAAMTAAGARLAPTGFYLDQPPGAARQPGLARLIRGQLAQRRAVAIALPGFRDRALATGRTSWDRDSVWYSGYVPDKLDTEVMVEDSGHAVCVVGFRPDPSEPLGGYFVFRNSWGPFFGREASEPVLGPPGPTRSPAPGYGVMSASHAENACWEAVSFAFDGGVP